ncbi:MAG: GTPase/DUF3482 domain-containing protein [Candidatus Krumholzibacteriia bacterium]
MTSASGSGADRPTFAVVGHPNKGKSSIVATLAHDDSVRIGELPGTTTTCRAYPMKVDGQVLYTLIDTPGFQRARAAWEWLRARETTVDRHPEVVRRFLAEHRGTGRFPDECELLGPVMEGAGILYVVDGSVPYGPEYDAEMEILRWTGQPRLALINPIGEADHLAAWRTALGQFFSVVRVFDAVTADFTRRVELLRAFGQLKDEWRAPLQKAADSLTADRRRRREEAARVVASTLAEMLSLRVDRVIGPDQDTEALKPELVTEYQRRLQDLERRERRTVERIYDHHALDRREAGLDALRAEDLFSSESWRVFGLTRMQLLGLGAVGGAAAGGAIDLATGGASFLAGTLIGGGIGAASTLLAANRLVDVKVLHVPMGRRRLVAGPSRNRNLPHVVLGRARLHHALVAGRSHAERNALDLDAGARELLAPLDDATRRSLEKAFGRLRGDREVAITTQHLGQEIAAIFARDEEVSTN